MIAPNPIFQVVEQVSRRLFAWSDWLELDTRYMLTAIDKTVRPSTARHTSLK